jgi:CSLREA domain-containing protein
VVNTTGDEPDADLSDGVCDADLSTDGEQCTLRAAIQEANNRAGEDTITFDSNVSAINPQKPLPDITETVTIDASSRSSSVELNGSNAGKNADGFSIKKGNLTIKNLTVSGFSGNGIKSDGNGDVTLKNVTIRKNGNDGIRTRGYVQLSEVEVTDNKAYGVFAKNDIVISGTETAVSKFSENGKIGLYSQTGNVAANEATLQVENNGDAGIAAENGDVSINFMTDKPAYYGRQSTIKGNGKSGIIANGGRRTNNNDEDTKIGNVRASNIVVEGNGAKIKGKITPKPSQRNGGHGINASGYVQLIEARVVDNKGYGISSKYDVAISGSETATNEFKNNGGAGIYCQLGNIAARDVIISVEENGRFGIGADKGGVFLNDATVINNKGIGIVVGGDLSINKGKVCDNNGGDIKVKGQESLGEDVVVCDRENQ